MKTNRMKRISLALCAVFLSLASCEDFLDTPPVSDYSSANLFQTVEQAKMATFGIYYTLTHDIYSRSMNSNISNDTDEMQAQGGNDATARRIIARYNTTPSNTGNDIKKVFDRLFAGIERANICIDRIPKMDLYNNGTEAEKKELQRFYGEALTLRAYYAFDLMKLWGDIPFKATPSEAGENFFVDRKSRDVTYDQIIEDLKTAVDLVPWRMEVAPQARWTKGAIKGILARIALHAAGHSLRWDLETGANIGMRTRPDADKITEYYQLARDQARDVINDPNHNLNPDFKNIWITLCGQQFDTQWGESMFEIGFWNPTGEQAGNGYIGNKIGVPTNSAVVETFGKGGSEVRVLSTYTLSFKPEDTRKAVTVADFNIDATGARVVTNRMFEYNPGKWRTWWATKKTTSDYTGINHILLRYADVLLMFAEADSWLNNGPTPEAIEALKEVRKRAYKGNEALIAAESYPNDHPGFMEVIMQERAWELGTEGLRKWDLIRWNKLEEVLNKTKTALAALATDTNVPLYVYYLPVTDPEQENPKVYGNTSTIPAPYLAQGYKRADFRNGLSANTPFFAAGFEPNKDELFPIVTASLGENPSLSQHPGF